MARQEQIPGYAMGSDKVPKAPISTMELRRMQDTAMFGDEDRKMLRRSGPILEKHADEIVDTWITHLKGQDHLAEAFRGEEGGGKIIDRYIDAVRRRLKQWIFDTADAEYDQTWLDYQFEIGRRLHRDGKNETDEVEANDHVPFRYLFPFTVPIVATLRPYLERDGASAQDIDKMLAAWLKSVVVQVTLWSHRYVGEKDY